LTAWHQHEDAMQQGWIAQLQFELSTEQ